MELLYLDHGATSYPKAPTVGDAMKDAIHHLVGNMGRTSGPSRAGELVYNCRQQVARLFHCQKGKYVVFTPHVTASINLVLQGLLRAGDHVITSGLEHNAVMRPLHALRERHTTYTTLDHDTSGALILPSLDAAWRPNTKALVITHASNVSGTVMPIAAIGEWCRQRHIFFIVDAAQTAGVLPIDIEQCHIDALCFTGHKHLLGPQGIGGIVLSPALAQLLTPTIYGGTGSMSDQLTMPDQYPDHLEAGTLNVPGIAGLSAALSYIEDIGLSVIGDHDRMLADESLRMGKHYLSSYDVKLLGLDTAVPPHSDPSQSLVTRTGLISLYLGNKDMAHVAYELYHTYHIACRVGLHCAPIAHRTLGTYPSGTLRLSWGYDTTIGQLEYAFTSIRRILQG